MEIKDFIKILPNIGKLKTHRRLLNFIVMTCVLMTTSNAQAAEDWVAQRDRIQPDSSPRIVGGTPVPAGERTFQVYLTESGQLVCGGSIVADNWVLTAAHCVDGVNLDSVVSGTQTLNSGGQAHSIVQTVIHPNWTSNGFGTASDLALLRINGTFASNLERLKLATPAILASAAPAGSSGLVSGWGLTSGGGSVSNQLLQVTNTILSDSACAAADGGGIDSNVVLCAEDRDKSSCNGDSGGPFTVVSNGETYSIGIVSFGPLSCDGLSAYTKTSAFTSWIQTQIGSPDGGGGTDDSVLLHNQPVTVAGNRGENQYYTFNLPDSVGSYTISIAGGSGDADLYVRKDTQPTTSSFDCRPYLNGNNETCSAREPAAGTYHVMLNGYTAYSGVTLMLSYLGGNTTPTPASTACPAGYDAYTGSIGMYGQDLIGTEYYAPVGVHAAINKGGSVGLALYKNRWGNWRRVASSSTQFNYTGRAGIYALTVNGAPNTPYTVCHRKP